MTAPRVLHRQPGPLDRSEPWVVGLDLSLRSTGICYASGELALVKPEDLRGMERVEYVLDAVRLACDCWESAPDLVVIEGYTYNTTKSAHVLGELGGVVRHWLWSEAIPYCVVAPGSLKKYATGRGDAKKTPMVVAARERLGILTEEDDEADALWLRAVGRELLGAPLVQLPKLNVGALGGLEIVRPRRPAAAS